MKQITNYIKKPKIAISLSAIFILFLANIAQVIFSVHHQDFRVAARYSIDTQTVIATSYWYSLYSYAAFAVLVIAFNLFAGWRLVVSRRTNQAFAVLLFTNFILFFSLLVGRVIFGLASGV